MLADVLHKVVAGVCICGDSYFGQISVSEKGKDPWAKVALWPKDTREEAMKDALELKAKADAGKIRRGTTIAESDEGKPNDRRSFLVMLSMFREQDEREAAEKKAGIKQPKEKLEYKIKWKEL